MRYAEINGTKYAKGYIVSCYIEDDVPVFGKISDIIIIRPSLCVLVVQPYLSTTFNRYFHAYQVSPSHDILFYQQHELTDFHPLFLSKSYLSPSPVFIRCKYCLYT